MRRIAVLVFVVGCSHDSTHAHDPDAPQGPRPDGDPAKCSAAAGTANVLYDDGTPVTFGRLDAGGTWFTGPAQVVGPPMSLQLFVTNADPVTPSDLGNCSVVVAGYPCSIDGLVLATDGIPMGSEVGTHPVTITRFGSSTMVQGGTLTITAFDHPFVNAPGHIAGSVSLIQNARTVTGSFDDAFCQAILSATI